MRVIVLAAVLIVSGAAGSSESPYAGQEQRRRIKALSEHQVEGYLDGRGMGYAKAAELNAFPGPRHVLDLAGELDLTPEQARRTRALFSAMKTRAAALGAQLVDKEKELDRRFATGAIDSASLAELVSDIGALEAKIRQVHLQAHLKQKALLEERQIRAYAELRGYASEDGMEHDHSR